VINEYAPHYLRGNAEEVSAVLPLHPFLIDEPQECLVDKSRCLECVVLALAPHVAASQPAQLVIDEGQQLVQRRLIAFTPVD
jgi:hypothetical protein